MIVALSGGKASAWCASWALRHYAPADVVLYFNDTGWEHPDLYRFLVDLERHFDKQITRDSDGRTPEELFYSERMMANSRVPFCSRVLKARRLQQFCQAGDVLIFGIGYAERHRAVRIAQVYAGLDKALTVRFPLISEGMTPGAVDDWLRYTGIEEPALYRLGFAHNNCSGGCVRAGKGQWVHLLRTLPDVYAERERVEVEISEHFGRRMTYMNGLSLTELRQQAEAQPALPFPQEDITDCIGICGSMA